MMHAGVCYARNLLTNEPSSPQPASLINESDNKQGVSSISDKLVHFGLELVAIAVATALKTDLLQTRHALVLAVTLAAFKVL
jgi:hypothetical protein